MRRRLSLFWVLGILLMWFTSNSQSYVIANSALDVGNPGGLRTASDFTTTGGTSILNGGSGSTTINHWSAATAIPFTFNFYGSPVTHFIVSKNGLLTFDTTNAGMPVGAALNVNTTLPNAALPNNTVAFFWEDTSSTSISTSDHVYTYTYGTSPNRQFWVHYYSFEVGTQSFCYWAMVMEETTDKIYVVDMGYAGSPSSYTGTVGVQVNSTTAYQVNSPLNGTMGSPNIAMGSGGTGATDNEYYTFQYFPAGACLPPSSLGGYNITSNSAEFYWTAGSASNWQIQIDTAGFSVGSGTWMTSTNDTINFSSLMSNAVYDVYVRDSCGVNDVSQWSGPFSFRTLCSSVSSFPWVEDFESTTSSIPDCWENEAGDDADWIFRSGSIGHGTTTDHTLGTSSGYYAGVDDSHSSTTDTVNNLLTPSFDLSSLTTPRLNFYYFIGNDATLTSTIYIDVYDGANWHLGVDTVSYSQEAWLRHLLDLTAYKSTATRIRFRVHETTDFNSDVSIDDVTVEETPNCPKSLMLGATNITATGADLYWTTGGATSWLVEYDTAGFTPGTGNSMLATNDTVSISGLTPITNYDFYVKDICAVGDSSAWSGPYSFMSGCAAFVAPHTETFDGTSIPACWSRYATSGGPWVFGGSGFNSSNCSAASDHTGNAGNFAWMDQSSTDVGVSLEMGDVDVSALTTAYLEFYYWMCGTGYSPVNLTYIEAWDGSAWVLVDSIAQATSGWEKFGFDVSSYTYGTNMLKLRFRAESGGSGSDFYGDNAIDDVSIIEAPSCFAPAGLGLVGVSDVSATVYWTTGGASNWNIEYGASGYTQGSGTMLAASNDTSTIGSLTAGMSYDVYVRDSCGVGDVSAWVGPLTFVTSPCDTGTKCLHTVILSDDYGDGWNGSEVTVYQGGVPVAVLGGSAFTSSIGNPPGDTLVTSLSLCDSVEAYFVITTGSTTSPYWSQEIGVELISPFGVPVAFYDNNASAAQGDTVIMIMPSCAQPSCAQPLSMVVSNVTATTAEVSWTSSASTLKTFVEYGISGYTPGTGMTTNTTADSIVLMSLMPMTTYDVCIWDSCSVTMSDTVCTSFTTGCLPFTAPYTETFDTTTTPQCWSQSATSGGPWLFGGAGTNSVNCSGAQDHTGNGGTYAWMDQSGTDVAVSLEIGDVDVSGLTTPYLEFYYWMCGSGYTPVNLTYIEAWDGLAWVLVDSIAQATAGWEKFGFDVSSYTYGTNLLRIRFRAESGGASLDFYGDNAIDDVSIIEAPTCFDPANLGATNISSTSADVYWTTGGATNWNLEYGMAGFSLGSGTAMNAANDTVSIGSLTAGTAYEFYVRDSCAVGDVSIWAGPYMFYTSVCDTSNQCQFIVHLKDSYGDGWNGGEVTIYQSGVPVQVLQYPVINGGQNDTLLVMTIPLCDNVNTVATISSTGSYPSEMGLELYDADTMLVGSHSATGGLSTGDTLFSFMAMCPVTVCDTAGVSNSAMACVTDTAINLAQYLGPHSSGGMWMDDDATGALTDSTFDASMVSAGTYDFTYYIASIGSCPADSATITVSVDTVIMLGASIADTICDSIGPINLDDLLDSTSTTGGSWVEVTSSGAISGGVFDPSMATGQTVTVRYKVSNACGMDSVDVSVYVADCSVGLNDYLSRRLEVYPNPAKDVLNISLKGEAMNNMVVQLYGANGKLVLERAVDNSKQIQLDMSSLPKGIYMLKVNSEEGVTARQITKM